MAGRPSAVREVAVMARMKVFAEVELYLDLDLPGIDANTMDHEVQQRRPDLLAALESSLTSCFGAGNWELVSFEFDVDRRVAP
jgi:hypothetical protein